MYELELDRLDDMSEERIENQFRVNEEFRMQRDFFEKGLDMPWDGVFKEEESNVR